jgi:hypothetical protein
MPLLNAFPATGGGSMLGDENWVPSDRCLFPIILWKIRCNPAIYKLKRVVFNGLKTFGGNIIQVFLG